MKNSVALLLTFTEAGVLLGVSRQTIAEMVTAGELRVHRVGRHRPRIPRAEVDRYVADGLHQLPQARAV